MSYVDPTSSIDRKWLIDTCNAHGVKRLENGNFRLPPARLGFCNLVEPKRYEPKKPGEQASFTYGSDFIFPHELTLDFFKVLNDEILRIGLDKCGPSFPTNPKLFKPLKEQVEKISTKSGERYSGYNATGLFISCSANADRKVPVLTDTSGRALNDATKFRAGNWVLPIVSAYHLNQEQKKGVTLGLEGAVFLAEDNAFGVESISTGQAAAGLDGLQAPPPNTAALLDS